MSAVVFKTIMPACPISSYRIQRGPGRSQRLGRALQVAEVGRDLRGQRAGEEHAAQGQEQRQRSCQGLLRPAQAGVPPLGGLGGRRGREVHGRTRRPDALVPLGPHIPSVRLANSRRAPPCARLSGVGTRNRPQSRYSGLPKWIQMLRSAMWLLGLLWQ